MITTACFGIEILINQQVLAYFGKTKGELKDWSQGFRICELEGAVRLLRVQFKARASRVWGTTADVLNDVLSH